MRQRLIQLEKAMHDQRGQQCPLCKGEPRAEILKVYGSGNDAYAFPELYLAEDYADRVTDDLR